MTTPTLSEIVDAIEARLATIPDLNAYNHPPAAPSFPCAFPTPPPINYRETMGAGVITLQFEIVVMDGTSAGHEQQVNLFDFLDWAGESSIFATLGADKTLGLGAKVDSAVTGVTRPLGLVEIGDSEAFGVVIPFLVVITNTP